MGFGRGPKIVHDNLHSFLDFASKKSYPDSGSTVFDLSGNGRNFNFYNSPTITDGKLILAGGGPHIGRSETFDWTNTDFTLSVWVYPQSTSYPAVLDLISAGNGHFRLQTSSTPALQYRPVAGSSTSLVNGGSISLNNWYNLVATRNGTSFNLYLNGKNVGTNSTSAFTDSSSMSWFRVGYSPDYDAGTRTYTGEVGSVIAYLRELSSEEVIQNYNATKSRFGL